LDVARLGAGYKRSQQVWSEATGDYFGENIEKAFNGSHRSIVAVPPKERGEDRGQGVV